MDLHFPHRFSNGYKIPADESYSVNGAMIYNQSIQLTNSNEIFQQNFLRKAVHHTYRKTGPLHRCLKIEFSKKTLPSGYEYMLNRADEFIGYVESEIIT